MPRIDAVVLSHYHYDHLDLPTLKRLAVRDHPVLLAGLGTRSQLAEHEVSGAHDRDWWQTHKLGGGVSIAFAPAQHWSKRGARGDNANWWGSFFIASASGSVYFAGDTGSGPDCGVIRKRPWRAYNRPPADRRLLSTLVHA